MVIINKAMNKITPIGKVIIPNHGNTSQKQLPSLLQGMPLVNSEIQAPLIPIKTGLKAKIRISSITRGKRVNKCFRFVMSTPVLFDIFNLSSKLIALFTAFPFSETRHLINKKAPHAGLFIFIRALIMD
jgi:hypothetical protein